MEANTFTSFLAQPVTTMSPETSPRSTAPLLSKANVVSIFCRSSPCAHATAGTNSRAAGATNRILRMVRSLLGARRQQRRRPQKFELGVVRAADLVGEESAGRVGGQRGLALGDRLVNEL